MPLTPEAEQPPEPAKPAAAAPLEAVATAPPTASDTASDEYRNAATGLRATARSIASAFAAIPALAVVAALIKGPGSGGWDPWLLVPGIIAATAGAIVGIYKFADVQRPGELTDAVVEDEQMRRLPEADDFPTFASLRKELEDARTRLSRATMSAVDARGYAEAHAAEAAAADATLAALVASATHAPDAGDLTTLIGDARERLVEKTLRAGDSAADAAVATRTAESNTLPFMAYDSLRRAGYGLALADIIKKRFDVALRYGAGAAALVALGITLVALAPKDKKEAKTAPAPAAPQLLYLTVTGAGLPKLECTPRRGQGQSVRVPAIKVGGTNEKPHVITFPTRECPTPKELDFKTGPAFGTATPAVPPKKPKQK